MDSDEIQKDVEGLVQELMTEKGVKNYELHFEGKSEAGDNYAGEIFFIRVEPEGKGETLNLVVKTAKRSKELNKFLPVEMVYNREVFVYAKVFPSFKKLIEETECGLKFDFVPRVYLISDMPCKQTLIFENLKTKGFRLHDRKKPWDLQHSFLAMEGYGELHALSFALKHLKPEEYKNLADQMPSIAAEFNKNLDVKAFVAPLLSNVMEQLRKNGREDLLNKYDGFLEEVERKMNHCDEDVGDKTAIGHVDCWNNNFMFQYQEDEQSKPKSICLLDFQLSVPCSPAKDLSYNIYTTCDKSCLDHFDQLLETYYASLSRCLRQLGCQPEEIFSFQELKEHWRKYGKYGLITALMIMKICLVEKENIPDFGDISKKAGNKEEFNEALNIVVKDEEEYNRRLLDVFVHFGENFL